MPTPSSNKLSIQRASGLLMPGNIDLSNRPKVPNPEMGANGYSTVRSIGVEIDGGRHVNIPTVIDGKLVTPDEAKAHFRRTKQHLGIYNSRQAADSAAVQLHKDQEAYYGQ